MLGNAKKAWGVLDAYKLLSLSLVCWLSSLCPRELALNVCDADFGKRGK
jgi:hypothetical protein